MYPKRASDLTTMDPESAKLVEWAQWANSDTIHGGASALVAAKRHAAKGNRDPLEIVGAVYSASLGHIPDHLDAWECGECGQVHYGRDAATECCAESFELSEHDSNGQA